MNGHDDLSDKERRKLYRDFSQAAKDIKVTCFPVEPPETGSGLEAVSGEEIAEITPDQEQRWESLLDSSRRQKRPSYRMRVKIDSYACSEGFDLCALKQFLLSLVSFLRPRKDIIHDRFTKALIFDRSSRSDSSGYSLSRTLLELRGSANFLLKGGTFLKRATDKRQNLKSDLQMDLATWEPFGFKLLGVFGSFDPHVYEVLEFIRHKYERRVGIDVYDLIEVVKTVYRAALRTDVHFEVVKERIKNTGEIIKSLYKRIYTDEQKIRQVSKKIEAGIDDFLGSYRRLKWFAHQLYPALLKMLNRFKEEAEAYQIAEQIFDFVGLGRKELIKVEVRTAVPEKDKMEEEQKAEDEESPEETKDPKDMKEEYRGILTIMEYAFPDSHLEKIFESDYTSLFWFQQKIFERQEHFGPALSRKPGFSELLWKISKDDPLAPVILLYEIIDEMLEAVQPDALNRIADPLSEASESVEERFTEIKNQWAVFREDLFKRYLQEIDYFEKEISLVRSEYGKGFPDTASGRKTVEMVNQIRNHIIRDYGHIALDVNRREYFKCRPLYILTQELLSLLRRLVFDRRQLIKKNPIILKKLEEGSIIQFHPSPIIRQIKSYLDAVPPEKRLLDNSAAESGRRFLEILYGLVDFLSSLLNNKNTVLKELGGEVVYAGKDEKEIRKRIDSDKRSLRVELKRDFQDIDQLTGLMSKNEYLRIITKLFREAKEKKESLSFLVADLDNFKYINDTQGHEFGDEVLRTTAQAVLSSMRDDDLAVRFGGEEIIIILNGDYRAGIIQAERIRKKSSELLSARYSESLGEIPLILASKEFQEAKRSNPHLEDVLDVFIKRWQKNPIGSLSIGVAQGLGEDLPKPCSSEKELFIRTDKMMYLAKESGRDRVVAMIDELGIPLLYSEFRDYQAFLKEKGIPDYSGFINLYEKENRPLTFRDYAYDEFIQSRPVGTGEGKVD